jgi:hypothetical protein
MVSYPTEKVQTSESLPSFRKAWILAFKPWFSLEL